MDPNELLIAQTNWEIASKDNPSPTPPDSDGEQENRKP